MVFNNDDIINSDYVALKERMIMNNELPRTIYVDELSSLRSGCL
jgi:hypothetical protein